jgi:Flp pilus assembly protein TadG
MKRVRSSQRGAATVEFALVLPVFLLILWFGIFAAWLGVTRVLLDHGAQAGARYAAIPISNDLRTYPSESDVATQVADATPLLTPGSVRVAGSATRNSPVTVDVSYQVPLPAPIAVLLHVFGNSRSDVTVTARAEARRE